MNARTRSVALVVALFVALAVLVGCSGPSAADVASQNVSTQLDPVEANTFRTRIILRPTTFIADYDLSVGW